MPFAFVTFSLGKQITTPIHSILIQSLSLEKKNFFLKAEDDEEDKEKGKG